MKRQTLTARLDAALDRIEAIEDETRMGAMIALAQAMRPKDPDDAARAGNGIKTLTERLKERPAARSALRDALLHLLAEKKAVHLFTDVGILSNQGFFTGLGRRLSRRWLPDEINRDYLKDVLALMFGRRSDYRWIEAVPDELWLELMHEIDFRKARGTPLAGKIVLQVLDALLVMSYRITSIGLEPEIVRNYPAIERYESPFLMQNVEMRQFIDDWKAALADKRAPQTDDKHLLVLLDQCRGIITRIRRQAEKSGASVSLTYLLVRLQQNLDRCVLLLKLLESKPEVDCNADRLRLFRTLVAGENRKNSIKDLFSQNIELLAQRITGNAGRAGEAYITLTRPEYFALFRSAAGAGFLVALMAFVKLWQAKEPHAPFVEAIAYSTTYAIGFMLMSALHWTLATKQPAMTANRIAHSMDSPDKDHDRLDGLADLIVRTLRSQFVAVLGNFALAIPVAVGLGYAVYQQSGAHYIDVDKAAHLLGEVDPLAWTTWFWGGLTGVWLFLSGLVSGYYDNKAVYSRIPQRLRQLRGLRRLLGRRGILKLVRFVQDHLGAMVGSLAFGVLLGSTAAVGKILGLPLNTLHVTFSTTNTFYALVALDWQLSWDWGLRVSLGIAAVGFMNLAVSFGLALYVALRSKRVQFADTWPLLGKLGHRLLTSPGQFLFPPRDAEPVEALHENRPE